METFEIIYMEQLEEWTNDELGRFCMKIDDVVINFTCNLGDLCKELSSLLYRGGRYCDIMLDSYMHLIFTSNELILKYHRDETELETFFEYSLEKVRNGAETFFGSLDKPRRTVSRA